MGKRGETSLDFSCLSDLARQYGCEVIAISDSNPLKEESARLRVWQEKGFAGEMNWMKKDPDLFAEPQRLHPGVRSIVFLAAHYSYKSAPLCPVGYGKVARYAWGSDYHQVLKERLSLLVEKLKVVLSCSLSSRIFSDAVPLLERAFAERAGLGFRGKNTLLIQPKRGSFFFIGEIFLDVEIINVPQLKIDGDCGSCVRCISNCPTKAIVSPFEVDARRCISYLTIEKRGVIPHDERPLIGNWLFGCDICQEVCPFNHAALKVGAPSSIEEFNEEKGAGPILKIEDLLGIKSDKQFSARFGHTAITRTRRAGLLRNACIVAENTGAVSVVDALRECMNDNSPVVRAHAFGAIAKLQKNGGILSEKVFAGLKDKVYLDVDEVKAEVNHL